METVEVEWQGMRVEATVPPPIATWTPNLSEPVVRRTEQAAAAVRAAGTLATGHLEAAARLLLRSEGLASSAIEGLRASAADVAAAEAVGAQGTTAAWVADNLAVVSDALGEPGPIDVPLVLRWHERLMRNATTIDAAHVGRWRDRLGWVGGSNPRLATHVAAPHQLIEDAMADLVAFAARDDIDAVTQAAIVHAQFETIHPFADGNGRIGRVLIGHVLAHRLEVAVPPPVSIQMARDVGGYQAGLTLYRQDLADRWVSWFADAVAAAAGDATDVLRAVDTLAETWDQRLAALRAHAAARRLVHHLPLHPVVSVRVAAELVGVSRAAAANAIDQLVERHILDDAGSNPTGPGRPERWWVANELLDLLGRG